MYIKRFQQQDAKEVSEMIIRTLMTTNIRDYTKGELEEVARRHRPEDIIEYARLRHFYVAEEAGRIIGCGSIGPYWDKEDESSLFTFFVRPECQGAGVGREIIKTLEQDGYALRARRIEIPASITAVPFYLKMGYTYKNGITKPDGEKLLRLEKYPENKETGE